MSKKNVMDRIELYLVDNELWIDSLVLEDITEEYINCYKELNMDNIKECCLNFLSCGLIYSV